MVSLRSKIILSMILMSFVGIALTALTARSLMVQRFNELGRDPLAESFMNEVIAYYSEYGSWEAALAAESHIEFVIRKRETGELPPPVLTPEDQPPALWTEGDGVLLFGPPAGPMGLPGGQRFGGTRPPRPPAGSEPTLPPPPFLVLDTEGRAMLSPIPGLEGELVPEVRLEDTIPVEYSGQVIGYLYSDARAALNRQHRLHLVAINDSWWITLLVVVGLSIPIGIIFGNRLGAPIDRLDRAIRAMQPGALKQNVPVSSSDELGHLSASFNQMSADLSNAYEELENSRQLMEEMSLQDPLTQLPNRRSFDESTNLVLTQAYRHNRPCVLAMIDIDRFKLINDNYSHATGDKVLKLLADLLRANLREVDILARYGGEEFLVLFPETDLSEAYKLMERLRETVAEHQWHDIDESLRITLSAGLVEVDINDTSSNTLTKAFNAADKKLYLAKDNGRNRTEC